MNFRRAPLSAAILLGIASAAPLAWADIGGVGSPVTPSNSANDNPVRDISQQETNAAAARQQLKNRRPLLLIRFNQPHVYFDKMVTQAVSAAEKASNNTTYEVVSYVPAYLANAKQLGGAAVESAQTAGNNMAAVVQEIQQQGVPASRISSSTVPQAGIKSQEIRIFVQ